MAAQANRQVSDLIQSGAHDFIVLPAGQTFTPSAAQTIIGIIIETAGTLVFTSVSGAARTFPSGLLATGLMHVLPMRSVQASGAKIWILISTV